VEISASWDAVGTRGGRISPFWIQAVPASWAKSFRMSTCFARFCLQVRLFSRWIRVILEHRRFNLLSASHLLEMIMRRWRKYRASLPADNAK
jgi:hypothetical protein